MIKSWIVDGAKLWKIRDIVVTPVVGQASYQIGPTATGPGAVVTDRPLKVTDAFIRDTTANKDWSLQMVSRAEYDLLGDKTTQGIPNQLYYDPQLDNGILYMYNVPVDTTHTIHIQCLEPLGDVVGNTATFDFPQEWYQPLKWGLADEIALEYGANNFIIQMVAAKAVGYRDKLSDFSVEETSTFFSPSTRFRS